MNEEMMFFQRYYIRTGVNNVIVHGFSDAFEQPQNDDILINERGEGTQFRLFPGGEENPSLFHTEHMIPLYKWDESKNEVIVRTEEEMQEEMLPHLIEQTRADKLAEINAAREATINAGVKVETSKGIKNFSLEDRDQLNLSASYGALIAALAGMPSPADPDEGVFYHADGEPHTFWSKEDFFKIVKHAFPHIAKHVSYYKDLRRYLLSLTELEDIEAVFYGMDIPKR